MAKRIGVATTIGAAAIGAAAGAAAIALSNKNSRKSVAKVVTKISGHAQSMVADLKKDPRVKKALKNGLRLMKDTDTKTRPMAKNVTKRVKAEAKRRLK